MDVVLLLIMASPGLCAVSSQTEGRVYHYVYELKTWTEAQSYCREKYTDLATIDNMEDVKTLNNMAAKRPMVKPVTFSLFDFKAIQFSWIGLYSDVLVMSWKWSLSDTSFYKQGEKEYRRWADGEPTAPSSGRHCSVMGANGRWSSHDCASRVVAVCSYVRGLNVTFLRINTNMTWTEAQSYCRANYTDLASVRNETENQKVAELMEAPGEIVWIGLFRDYWKWSDGSDSASRYWKEEQPTVPTGDGHACVAANFHHSGRWGNWACYNKLTFICYRVEPVSKTTMKTMKVRFERKNSSLDPNDPAVMDAILKQFKQKLKDQGVNDNVKLSWKKQSDGKVFHKEEKKTKKKTNDEF